MLYSPDREALVCPYCDSVRKIAKTIPNARNYYVEREKAVVIDVSETYLCPNCGGEVVLENFVTATKCPFCSATNIIKKELLIGLKPDSILPFRVSQAKALEVGKKWIKKRIYAPSKIKKNFDAKHFNGIYVPSFSFDSESFSTYHGQLGEYYYVTVGSGKNRRTVRRTRWFSISGKVQRAFDDILIESSKQLNQNELDNILPYDTIAAEEYKREYLAGFSSERYDSSLDDSFEAAKGIMSDAIRKEILSRYSYDIVGSLNVNTTYGKVLFNYTMLPLWVCGYKFREKMYRYIVNGRSGAATGKYPISVPKVASTVIGIIAVIVGIALAIYLT